MLGRKEEAAEAWKKAAMEIGTSPKMYFNYACVLSELRKYADALTALEKAINLDLAFPEHKQFYVREKAKRSPEGSEFKPFWPGSQNEEATNARSAGGKTFAELTGEAQ
jgi:tetratricopeptide (TPR) repeat protein